MRHILITIAAALLFVSAAAQETDTTSTVSGEKLNFEEPNFMVSTYFESVKAHLSAEGRKAWKPEFSVRGNVMVFVGTVDLTGGIRTSPNKVFGLGIGRCAVFHDAIPAHSYRMSFYLYHRHYLPIDRKRRFSFYSDLSLGGMYLYKVTGTEREPRFEGDRPTSLPKKGTMDWWYSWQPGFSIRLWGKSNIFFGPTIGPSIGAHLGVAI